MSTLDRKIKRTWICSSVKRKQKSQIQAFAAEPWNTVKTLTYFRNQEMNNKISRSWFFPKSIWIWKFNGDSIWTVKSYNISRVGDYKLLSIFEFRQDFFFAIQQNLRRLNTLEKNRNMFIHVTDCNSFVLFISLKCHRKWKLFISQPFPSAHHLHLPKHIFILHCFLLCRFLHHQIKSRRNALKRS